MFSPNTTYRLNQAASLVNTTAGHHGGQVVPDRLDTDHLTGLLTGPDDPSGASTERSEPPSGATLRSVRKLRAAVSGIWHDAAAEDTAAALAGINHLLSAAGPVRLSLPGGPGDGGPDVPAASRHADDGPASGAPARTPAVLDAGREGDPAEKVLSIALALALTDVALAGELTRLRTCSGEACDNAFVDLTRNRSKQFCDEANCANRAHVRAYRARRAAEAEGDDGTGDQAAAGRSPGTADDQAGPERGRDGDGKKSDKKADKSSGKKDKGKKKSKKDKKK